MKKKIIDIVVDILLFTVIFSATDLVIQTFFHSDSVWLELGIYLVLYAIVFGVKGGILSLWRKRHNGQKDR